MSKGDIDNAMSTSELKEVITALLDALEKPAWKISVEVQNEAGFIVKREFESLAEIES